MTRNLLLLVHLVAVAAWLGANLVQFVVGPRLRAQGGEIARRWSDTALFLGRRYYNVVGVVVALSGIGLVMEGDWRWRGFVLVGIAMVVVGATLGITRFDPLLRRESAALAAEDLPTAKRLAHTITRLAVLDTFLLLVTMLAMIDRWNA